MPDCFRKFGAEVFEKDGILEWKPNPKDYEGLLLKKAGVRYEDFIAYKRAIQMQSVNAKVGLRLANVTDPSIAYKKVIKARAKQAKVKTTYEKYFNKKKGVYKPTRAEAHEKIVNKLLRKGQVAKKGKQQALFTGGKPGSGKSSMLDSPLYKDKQGFLELNPDAIKAELAKLDGYKEIGIRAGQYHLESKHVMEMLFRKAVARNMNVLVDTTMNTASTIKRILGNLKSKGYYTEIAFAELPMQKAIERGISRFLGPEGRFVDPIHIASNDGNNIRTFKSVRKYVNKWRYWSTDVEKGQLAKLISEGGRKKPVAVVKAYQTFEEFKNREDRAEKFRPYIQAWCIGDGRAEIEEGLSEVDLDFICDNCKHYEGNGKCKAFPEGIPLEIYTGKQVHLGAVDGQEGDYVFQAV